MDLTQAEGIADLIEAETRGQKTQALAQTDGALGKLYSGKACLVHWPCLKSRLIFQMRLKRLRRLTHPYLKNLTLWLMRLKPR